MTTPKNVLNTHPPEFERFLYASVGKDRNGNVVTLLSAFARLGLDPWSETAELVKLGHETARARLSTLLARFRDVPALASDHYKIAGDLSFLLPEGPTSVAQRQVPADIADGHKGKQGMIWAALAIMFALFQLLTSGGSGSGE